MLNNCIFILLIIVVSLILIKYKNTEHFDFSGNQYQYPWYRDPYSIYLWEDMHKKQRWWNIFHRRKYLHLNNYMYLPKISHSRWI